MTNRTREQKLKSLRVILSDTYALPDFQRFYEWTAPSAVAFIEFLLDQSAASESVIPLGAIYVYREGNSWVITDGQQRLVTLCLAAAALRQLLGTLYDGDRLWLVTHDKEQLLGGPRPRIVFPHTVGGDDAYHELTKGPLGTKLPSGTRGLAATPATMHKNTRAIYQLLCDRFGDDPHRALEVFDAILERVEFTFVIMESRTAAIEYFEKLNQNQRPLAQSSLVKNSLIAAADRLGVTGRINAAFAAIEASCSSSAMIDKRMHHTLVAHFDGRAKEITASHCMSWVDANRDRCGVDTDPAGLAELLAAGNIALQQLADAKKPGSGASFALRLLAGLRGDSGPHAPVVVAASQLPQALFDRACFRLAGLAAVAFALNRRGGDVLDGYLLAVEGLRALGATSTVMDVDVVFDAAAQQIVKSGYDLALAGLAGRSLSDAAKARALLALAASTYVADCHYMDVLQAVYASAADVEHICPQSGDLWDCSADPSATQSVMIAAGTRHLLGNLTILNSDINRSTQDAAFSTKRAAYSHDRSLLTSMLGDRFSSDGLPSFTRDQVRADLGVIGGRAWHEQTIRARSGLLAERVLRASGLVASAAPTHTPVVVQMPLADLVEVAAGT